MQNWEQSKDALTFGKNKRLREKVRGWDPDVGPYVYNVVVTVGNTTKEHL